MRQKVSPSNCLLSHSEFINSSAGWNWGELGLNRDQLEFLVDGHPCFDIPVSDIAQCSSNRNDFSVRLHQYDTISAEENDVLVEMRFSVPETNARLAALGNDAPAKNLEKLISDRVCSNFFVEYFFNSLTFRLMWMSHLGKVWFS